MIFESKQEKEAFEFICDLASELTDKRVSNDLSIEDMNKFKNLLVESEDTTGKPFVRNVSFDADVIVWLKAQSGYNETM